MAVFFAVDTAGAPPTSSFFPQAASNPVDVAAAVSAAPFRNDLRSISLSLLIDIQVLWFASQASRRRQTATSAFFVSALL
jgi:hypothetical protein